MPHNNPGHDIRSTRPDGTLTFIEVKGRVAGAETFAVTQNELRFAANIPGEYVLAMVEVSPDSALTTWCGIPATPYGDGVRLPFDTTTTTLSTVDGAIRTGM